MSWISTSASQDYLEAVTTTKTIEAPAVGFAKLTDYSAVVKHNAAIIKQNNTLLYLIVQQAQKIGSCEESLKVLKDEVRRLGKADQAPLDLDKAVGDLTKRLDNITLGDQPKRNQSNDLIYVFTDPKKIFEQEKAKPSYSK